MKCHIKLPPGASQGTTKSSSADSWIQRLVSENGLTKIDINQSSAVVWLHHTSNDIYVVQNPKYVQYIPINTGSRKNCHFPFRQKFPSTLGIYDITGEETSPTGKNRHFDLLMVPLHFISEHDSLPLPIDQ